MGTVKDERVDFSPIGIFNQTHVFWPIVSPGLNKSWLCADVCPRYPLLPLKQKIRNGENEVMAIG